MRKLKLEVDSLRVESFASVTKDAEEQGTVHAHASAPNACLPPTDSVLEQTCAYTCAGLSCIYTCAIYCAPYTDFSCYRPECPA